jgi:prevent-host-death family protein
MPWQIQQAKQRLSEVIRHAKLDGPQQLTDRGEPSAWILSESSNLAFKASFAKASSIIGL